MGNQKRMPTKAKRGIKNPYGALTKAKKMLAKAVKKG